jgi:hypothetical protein
LAILRPLIIRTRAMEDLLPEHYLHIFNNFCATARMRVFMQRVCKRFHQLRPGSMLPSWFNWPREPAVAKLARIVLDELDQVGWLMASPYPTLGAWSGHGLNARTCSSDGKPVGAPNMCDWVLHPMFQVQGRAIFQVHGPVSIPCDILTLGWTFQEKREYTNINRPPWICNVGHIVTLRVRVRMRDLPIQRRYRKEIHTMIKATALSSVSNDDDMYWVPDTLLDVHDDRPVETRSDWVDEAELEYPPAAHERKQDICVVPGLDLVWRLSMKSDNTDSPNLKYIAWTLPRLLEVVDAIQHNRMLPGGRYYDIF